MTGNAKLERAALIDRHGKPLGFCRVPSYPNLPRLILWGNHNFVRMRGTNVYEETACYMVKLEDMYASSGPAPTAGVTEVK